MSKINFLTICVVVLVLLNAGTLFYLFRSRKGGDDQPKPAEGGPAAYIIKQLKLNDQQQADFAKLRTEHQASMRPARDEDRKLHEAFFGLVKAGKHYGPEADSLISRMAAQRRIMETATYMHFQKLRSLCTDQQKPLLDEMIDELGGRISQPQGGPPPGDHPGEGHPPPPMNGEHPPGPAPH